MVSNNFSSSAINSNDKNFDPRVDCARVKIKNIKSGKYLSVEGDSPNWLNDDASLTIRPWLGLPILESSQVWRIFQQGDNSWVMLNQKSGLLASIRARSTDNNATAIQYHIQNVHEKFQHWDFELLENGNFLIKNIHSQKYIGPQARSTEDDHYCIQWEDQTKEDSYQQWVFETI